MTTPPGTNGHGGAALPLFDPAAGRVVLEPEAPGEGYWVGAPSVARDPGSGRFYVCFRRRRPRDIEPDRGYEAAIAASDDGTSLQPVWRMEKGELDSTSIERCSLLYGHDGVWRYYLSYVDPRDRRWRVDVVEAERPEALDVRRRREVFTAASASRFHRLPVEGVKDPRVYRIGHLYWMLLSYAEGWPGGVSQRADMHRTGDVYNTGLLTAPSAWATSTDGVRFRWHGTLLGVGDEGNWDGYQVRLGSVIRHDGIWYGLYDGSRSRDENYEERLGLVQSFDLRHWKKVSETAPLITVPWRSGSVRYVDALRVGDEIRYWYEMAREDGAHELRCAAVPAGAPA